MKAAIFDGADAPLRIDAVAAPVLGPDELLLKVAYTGICGSDLHAAETPGVLPLGTVMGHEFTGEVVDSHSRDWRVGDRAAANPLWVCDVCAAGGKCHSGRDPACASAAFMGFKPDLPGAYAQYVRIRASQAIRLPADLGLRDAALMEPLAVAHHAVARCDSLRGEHVLVIGGGPIGLGVALLAREAGAATVVVSEPDATRRTCALRIGATATIDPAADTLPAAMTRLGLGAPDVVFECVGAPGFLQMAIDVMAVRARAVIVGVCMTEDRVMPRSAIAKEASLQFVLGYTRDDFAAVAAYLSRDAAKASAMISDVVPLEALPETFGRLQRDKSMIKVLVAPNA